MAADPNKVIVTIGATPQATQANHRDFPDARAEGESPAIAARNLVKHLAQALDSASADQARSTIQQAIDDVQAYVDQNP
jgi:hypothetical protein